MCDLRRFSCGSASFALFNAQSRGLHSGALGGAHSRPSPLRTVQHVTWRMAFVSFGFLTSVSRAWSVGRISSSISRRRASRFTSAITGSDPYLPVPTMRRWHFQGISSSTDTGVCPNSSRNFFEGFFRRWRILPRSITTSCLKLTPSILIEPNLKFAEVHRKAFHFRLICPSYHGLSQDLLAGPFTCSPF